MTPGSKATPAILLLLAAGCAAGTHAGGAAAEAGGAPDCAIHAIASAESAETPPWMRALLAGTSLEHAPFIAAQRPVALANRPDVNRALVENYSQRMREEGVGGIVTVGMVIDTAGTVVRQRLEQTSGHRELDEAGMRVAAVMRFRPAIADGCRVHAVVQIPVVFQVR
jgi:TonB family protein